MNRSAIGLSAELRPGINSLRIILSELQTEFCDQIILPGSFSPKELLVFILY